MKTIALTAIGALAGAYLLMSSSSSEGLATSLNFRFLQAASEEVLFNEIEPNEDSIIQLKFQLFVIRHNKNYMTRDEYN